MKAIEQHFAVVLFITNFGKKCLQSLQLYGTESLRSIILHCKHLPTRSIIIFLIVVTGEENINFILNQIV